jgi:hypothetical protein
MQPLTYGIAKMTDSQIMTNDQGDYIGRRFKCRCNAWIESYQGSDIDCSSCGRLFNSVGQELNPQSQWSENNDY